MLEEKKEEKKEINNKLINLEYWSEYDVPLGIVERIHNTIRKFSE